VRREAPLWVLTASAVKSQKRRCGFWGRSEATPLLSLSFEW
jgi:hypothetical protein